MKLIFPLLLLSVTAVFGGSQPDTIYVSNDYTVYILFETEVGEVDLGNQQYIFQKDKTMVLVKAKKAFTSPTSFMVKTASKVFVWIIAFKQKPTDILIDTKVSKDVLTGSNSQKSNPSRQSSPVRNTDGAARETAQQPRSTALKSQSLDEYLSKQELKYQGEKPPERQAELEESENRDFSNKDDLMQNRLYYIIRQERIYKSIADIKNGLYFSLSSIFVDRQYLYVKLQVLNTSSIAFEIDYISTELSAKPDGIKRRKSNSRKLINRVYHESVFNIAPSMEESIVLVYDLFACNEKDEIYIKMNELGGSRSLLVKIPGKLFNNAKPL